MDDLINNGAIIEEQELKEADGVDGGEQGGQGEQEAAAYRQQ